MNDLIVIEDDAAPALPVMASAQEIAACNYLAEGVRGHMQKAWQMAVALGYRLTLLKARCDHGEWGKLFSVTNANTRSHFSFGVRAAEKYIQLFHACEARARQLEQSEGLLELLGYTTGVVEAEAGVVDIQAKSEELSGMLTGMAPYAENMSQALFSFMYPEETAEPEAAQEFFRGGRNKKGRVRPKKDEGKSEAELLKERRWAISKQLEGLACGIDDLGAEIALAFPEARDHAIATMERSLKILQKLK